MDNFTIYCTSDQTLKALSLGAPIEVVPHDYDRKSIYTEINGGALKHPTTAQMIGWLREEKGIYVMTEPSQGKYYGAYSIRNKDGCWYVRNYVDGLCDTYEAATLLAIDEALNVVYKMNE